MSNIIHLNESELKNQLGELVRGTHSIPPSYSILVIIVQLEPHYQP